MSMSWQKTLESKHELVPVITRSESCRVAKPSIVQRLKVIVDDDSTLGIDFADD